MPQNLRPIFNWNQEDISSIDTSSPNSSLDVSLVDLQVDISETMPFSEGQPTPRGNVMDGDTAALANPGGNTPTEDQEALTTPRATTPTGDTAALATPNKRVLQLRRQAVLNAEDEQTTPTAPTGDEEGQFAPVRQKARPHQAYSKDDHNDQSNIMTGSPARKLFTTADRLRENVEQYQAPAAPAPVQGRNNGRPPLYPSAPHANIQAVAQANVQVAPISLGRRRHIDNIMALRHSSQDQGAQR
jgi:hypothetical protein